MFTDADLKRLKFKMENAMNMEQSVLVSDPDGILALLARLEAAERCINPACGSPGCLDEAYKVWRKAAGK